MKKQDPQPADAFDDVANRKRLTFFGEVFLFLGQNKKWWLLPIIIVFVLFGVLLIFGSGAAPFIYTLF